MHFNNVTLNNSTLRFRPKTNGERALLDVNISADRNPGILDHTSNETINWTRSADNSITFTSSLTMNMRFNICID